MNSIATDICIVGAGPAGLVLARALADSGRDVVVLESGVAKYVESIQALNDGTILGDAYADLRSVRRRQLGGTVNAWNTAVRGEIAAKYVPLDPIDLETRGEAGLPGWPIAYAELVPWYEAAQRVCGLGPFDYRAESWSRDVRRDTLGFAAGSGLETRIYQIGTADALTKELLRQLRVQRGVTIACGVTATELLIENPGGRAVAVLCRTRRGNRLSKLHANVIILAAGAIENARLLLASAGLCDSSGLVGRYFMEHPRDYAMRWTPKDPAIYQGLRFYDQHESDRGIPIMGRLSLDEATLRDHGLTQASITLQPHYRVHPGRLAQWARRLGLADAAKKSPGRAGWSERDPSGKNWEYVQLLLNLEQAPHWENSVRLLRSAAANRASLVSLEWRWRREDQERLARVRGIIADAFTRSDHGRVDIDSGARPDPNAHHHAGTTRMSDDPKDGVVDRNGRVHSVENVYCAGASVFPSAGFANPTLTIVALALRLATHLVPAAP